MISDRHLFSSVPDDADGGSSVPEHAYVRLRDVARMWEEVRRRERAVAAVGASSEDARHPFRDVGPDCADFREFAHCPGAASDAVHAGLFEPAIRECLDWLVGEIRSGRWLDPREGAVRTGEPVSAVLETSLEERSESGDLKDEDKPDDFGKVAVGEDGRTVDIGEIHDDAEAAASAGAVEVKTGEGIASGTLSDGTRWGYSPPEMPSRPVVSTTADAVHRTGADGRPGTVTVDLTSSDGGAASPFSAKVEVPGWDVPSFATPGKPELKMREGTSTLLNGVDVTLGRSDETFFVFDGSSGGHPNPLHLVGVPKGAVVVSSRRVQDGKDVKAVVVEVRPPPAYARNFVDDVVSPENPFSGRFQDAAALRVPPWPYGCAPLIPVDRDGSLPSSYGGLVQWRPGISVDPTLAASPAVVSYVLECLDSLTRTRHSVGSVHVVGSASAESSHSASSVSVGETVFSYSSSSGDGEPASGTTVTRSSNTYGYEETASSSAEFDAYDGDVTSGLKADTYSDNAPLATGMPDPFAGVTADSGIRAFSEDSVLASGRIVDTPDYSSSETKSVEDHSFTSKSVGLTSSLSVLEPVVVVDVRGAGDGETEFPWCEPDYATGPKKAVWKWSRKGRGSTSSEKTVVTDGMAGEPEKGGSEWVVPAPDGDGSDGGGAYDHFGDGEDAVLSHLAFIPDSVKDMVKSAVMYAVLEQTSEYTHHSESGKTGTVSRSEGSPPPDEGDGTSIEDRYFKKRGNEDFKQSDDSSTVNGRRYGETRSVIEIATYSEGVWTPCIADLASLLPDSGGEDGGTKSDGSVYSGTANDEEVSYHSSSSVVGSSRRATVHGRLSGPFVVIDWDFSSATPEEEEEEEEDGDA